MRVKGWPHGLEFEAQHTGFGLLAAQQVHQQCGNQWAVNDQARVAFDLGDILSVVVNAVPVEGERRLADQQLIVGNNGSLPR